MEWTGLNELRKKFLDFYVGKGHTLLPSAPLVPQDEASLLIINSGMAPLKKYFIRQAFLPGGSFRATSCQKCIRTPDIENVGKDDRHGTFFEMLGNFSFGDYFKEDAIRWAWEFLTGVLQMDKDRLYPSVFTEDDEAYDIWTKEVGVAADHMVRLGRDDNFWEIGSGPCGPCSEIYYDRGQEHGCGKPTCGPGCDCDRYVEIWNLVFTQFNSDGDGHYVPLEHKNIDTGMGLERLACVVQGVNNLFEVDTVRSIMDHICRIAGVQYKDDPKKDVSIRVVTDHIRSTVFMVGDGILPQNEGRGYVLRRLLRRAARHGRLLGIREPFLYKVADTVIEMNRDAYPDLVANRDYIVKVIRVEEERFAKTIDAGLEQVGGIMDGMAASGQKVFPGADAFRLYDTYGFPIDLTRELCAEKGFTVDEAGYQALMEKQRSAAREATRVALGDVAWVDDVLAGLGGGNVFTGYRELESDAKVIAIIDQGKTTEAVGGGESAQLVLDRTPFYAESGGQVGDRGVITCGDSLFEVEDCKKSHGGHCLHIGRVKRGHFSVGDTVKAAVDRDLRWATMRNHTAAHLLQRALRETLGEHVHQAGQLVDEHYCRFDFSHFSAMTPEELRAVENKVNAWILEAVPVTATEMPIEEAKKLGAMALFGEKYGSVVRVVDVQGRTREFCGGTHVDNTARLGLFKIVKESSVAAGVRRIEATTGTGVLGYIAEQDQIIAQASEALKAGSPAELPAKAQQSAAAVRQAEKMREELEGRLAELKMAGLFDAAKDVEGLQVIAMSMVGTKPDALRLLTDNARGRNPNVVAVLATSYEGKGSIAAGCGANAVARGVHAGKLVKAICALTGGSGGGRPDSAMGGAGDMFKMDEALVQVADVVRQMVK